MENIMTCILVGIHGGQLTSYYHHYVKLTFSKTHYHKKSHDEWKRFIITLFQPSMNLNIFR
jgi:hypothetical protein